MKRQALALAILVSILLGACGTAKQDATQGIAEPTTTRRPRETRTSTVVPAETSTATASPSTPTPSPTATPSPPRPIDEEQAAKLVPVATFKGEPTQIDTLAFSPDGQRLAVGASDGTVRLWPTQNGSAPLVLDGKGGKVWSLAFSSDGNRLFTASNDGAIRFWQVSDGSLLDTVPAIADHVYRVAVSPNGSLLTVGGNLCMVELRYARDGLLAKTLDVPSCNVLKDGPVVSWGISFSSDNSLLAVGEGRPCCGGSVRLYTPDHIGYTFSSRLRGSGAAVRDLAFSPDASLLAIATSSNAIELRRVSDGTLVATLAKHLYRVNDVDFSPNGKLLASASRDGTVKIWRTSDGTLVGTLEGDKNSVTAVAFSPDGSVLASATEAGAVTLWGAKP